ncbi:MAG: long-chain fatty acid--CoA ligase [Betaproteobacteria bacterium]|nr:long-chain fatty acid--CoA ligase [Betaproteobacteria bacterium]
MPLDAILSRARSAPDHLALVHNGEPWSYSAFARAIADARARLAGAGFPPGSLVVVAIEDLVDAWVAGFALRSLGLATIAIERTTDVAALALGSAGGIVTRAGATHEAAESLARQAGRATIRLPAARPAAFARGGAPGFPLPAAGMAGHVMLTSGTTGSYKKVLRDPRIDREQIGSLASLFAFTPSSVVFVGNFPSWTAGGYRWTRAAWSVGATVVCENSPEPWRPFGRLGMTHAFATPATLAVLLEAPPGAIRRDDSLRLVVTAGALTKALADGARARITRELYSAYASTEASMVTMTRIASDEDLLWHLPVSPRAAQVVDESGRELPVGDEGLVRVRPSPGIEGYLDDEATTRECFRDGWFLPGDLGRLRADGRLCLQGRATEVINLLGLKVATAPLERSLQDLLGVSGVCIFSRQDDEAAEEVHVAIESATPVDRVALADFARSGLGAFPRVHFHVAREFPRSAMGKVRRLELRRRLLAPPEPRS